MKTFWLGGVAALAIMASLAGQAHAADLPAAAPAYKTPAVVPSPAFNWAGFYVGANGGYGTSRNCWAVVAPPPAGSEGCHNATGGVAGGQIGYRWQSSAWVFGLEAQGDWASLSGSNVSTLFPGPVFGNATNRTRVDAFGLLTGQVGYAWTNALVYLKGGAAVARDRFDGFTATVPTGPFLPSQTDVVTDNRWGGTVGVGFEYGFSPNRSAGFEYDHLFLGRRNLGFIATSLTSPVVSVPFTESISQDVDLITVRINYRFGGPIVAKY